jgi:excisionase family DNA binding protein
MSVADMAKERNLKQATVQSWCRKGWLPAEQVGRAYRVKRSDWEAFLRKGFQLPKSNGLAAFAH